MVALSDNAQPLVFACNRCTEFFRSSRYSSCLIDGGVLSEVWGQGISGLQSEHCHLLKGIYKLLQGGISDLADLRRKQPKLKSSASIYSFCQFRSRSDPCHERRTYLK